jgi:hypothetical protein
MNTTCFYLVGCLNLHPLGCGYFCSRWVSRSATTQRRKERLRQHSEHIGLDNDLREVCGCLPEIPCCNSQELGLLSQQVSLCRSSHILLKNGSVIFLNIKTFVRTCGRKQLFFHFCKFNTSQLGL